jgi:hypothetical protein
MKQDKNGLELTDFPELRWENMSHARRGLYIMETEFFQDIQRDIEEIMWVRLLLSFETIEEMWNLPSAIAIEIEKNLMEEFFAVPIMRTVNNEL